MSAATVTSKGQITVPKEIRELLGLRVGDRLLFRQQEDGSVVVEAAAVDIRTLRGSLRAKGKRASVEQQHEGLVAAVARSFRRSVR